MNIKLEIPESFYQGEERCGYYVSPEMKKVWAVELDLITEFARVCEKYNLEWFVDWGTLLGAVRHKGFIPWDDDVDIIMMRKDYDRFCEIAQHEFKTPYEFSAPKNDETDVLLTFTKLYNEDTTMIEPSMIKPLKQGININLSKGIYIDIFPADNVPDDDKLFMRRMRKAKLIWLFVALLNCKNITYNTKKWKLFVKAVVQKFLNAAVPVRTVSLLYHKYFVKFIELVKFNDWPHSKRIIDSGSMVFDSKFNAPDIFNRSDFAETIKLPFEMIEVNAPSGYVNILDKLYGDWHKFKIHGKHSVFYDTERSYKYYTEEGHPFKAE